MGLGRTSRGRSADCLNLAACSHRLNCDIATTNHWADSSLATCPYTGGCHTAGVSQGESPESRFYPCSDPEGAPSSLPRATLEQASLREREHRRSADNEVIENSDIDQGKRLFEGLGQGLVCVTGLGATGRVVMHEHDPRGIARKGCLDHFPQENRSLGQSSREHRLELDQAIRRIKKEYAEDFPLESGKLQR